MFENTTALVVLEQFIHLPPPTGAKLGCIMDVLILRAA